MTKINKTIIKILFFILIPLFITLKFIPGFTNYLLSDDWIVIHRNMNLTFPEIIQLFTSTNYGWYRPVFELFIALCSLVFYFQAIGYHIVILFLYLIVLFLIGKISFLVTKESGIGFLSAFVFGLLSIHSETVLWISASNEIISAFFMLSSYYFYLLFKKSVNKIFSYSCSLIFMVAALSTKETAMFFPLIILLTEYFVFKERDKRITFSLLYITPFLFIQLFYFIIRINAGFPYEISFTSIKVFYVIIFYLVVIVFSMPDNYGHLSSINLWKYEPLFPITIVLFSFVSLSGLFCIFIKYSGVKHLSKYNKLIKLSIGWILISLLPVLQFASARTAFLMSIGYSWIFSIFIYTIITGIKNSNKEIKLAFATFAFILIIINTSVFQYRSYYWRQAGYTVNNITLQINNIVKSIPEGEDIYIFGLPDHINRAYTFRNAIPTINQIYYPKHNLKVWLDTEVDTLSLKKIKNQNTFIYKNGILIKPN